MTKPVCGDGEVNGDEVCDGSASDDGCSDGLVCDDQCTACLQPQVDDCGDGEVTGAEACDESADESGCEQDQLCNVDCSLCEVQEVGPSCGDREVNGDEICDATSFLDVGCQLPTHCNSGCNECGAGSSFCGDGDVAEEEVCDGSSIVATGCPPGKRCNSSCDACKAPPRCGDGEVNGDEVCDGATGLPNSGCGDGQYCASCMACVDIEATCGDGEVSDDEVCDASAGEDDGCDDFFACDSSCRACQRLDCGDGERDRSVEVCDQSAEATGCDDGWVCLQCSFCVACGDLELDFDEQCDNNGVSGAFGSCDNVTEYCSDSCQCEPRPIRIIEAEASGLGPSGVFGFNLVIHEEGTPDERVLARFHLALLTAEGNVVAVYRPGTDLLIDSRFVPLDDAEGNIDYEWRAQVHLLSGVPSTTASAWLALMTVDNEWSNAFIVAADEVIVGGEGDDCDAESTVAWCERGLACEAGTCTAAPALSLDEISVSQGETEGSLRFELTVTDDGDVLPYWILVLDDIDDEPLASAFRGYDPVDGGFTVDNGDGTLSLSLEIPDVEADLGVAVGQIASVTAIVFDSNDSDLDFVFVSE